MVRTFTIYLFVAVMLVSAIIFHEGWASTRELKDVSQTHAGHLLSTVQLTLTQAGKPANTSVGQITLKMPEFRTDDDTIARASCILLNNSAHFITIDHVTTSCGCTNAIVDRKGRGLPILLGPKDTANLSALIKPSLSDPGRYTKTIWIYSQESDLPVAIITLSGFADSPRHGQEPSIPPLPVIGHIVADFKLPDVHGSNVSLEQFRGKPTAIFFFCACPNCHSVASAWTKASTSNASGRHPESAAVVVFMGEAADASKFIVETGLGATNAVVLCDADSSVSSEYGAEPCPRAFVVDSAGNLVYTNDHKDDSPGMPSSTIIRHVIDALDLQSREVIK